MRQQIILSYEDLPQGNDGVSKGGSIVIANGLEPGNHFAVLVHELAHELLHRGERRDETTRKLRETEAEAGAYVVCKSIGLKIRSSDYIQLYAGDDDLLMHSLEHIQRVTSLIIAELQQPPAAAAEAE